MSLRSSIADAIVVGVLLTLAIALGTSHAHRLRIAGSGIEPASFNHRVFAAALMAACGRGLTTPSAALLPASVAGDPVNAGREFLLGRRESITCAELPAGLAGDGLDGLQRASRYLLLAVSWAWTLAGPKWAAIDGLMGLMFAASIGLAYGASRVAMGRLAASFVAVALMISPLHLANLADVRDYSKAPFFLFGLGAVGLLATQAWSLAQVVAVAALSGLVLGFGLGMRTDVLVNVIVVVAVVLVFVPGKWRETWRTRLAGATACVLACGAMAAPLIGSYETRSSPWHVALLGYAQDWTQALEISGAPYETGYFYSDSYVGSMVDASWGARGHGDAKVAVGLPGYSDASRGYYFALLSMFPADALIRGWGSMIKVLELPFSGAAAVRGDLHGPWLARPMAAAQAGLLRLESVAVALFAITVVGLSVYRARLAALVFLLTVVLGAYPSIQFQPRHSFHLEILSLWLLGFAGSWAIRRAPGWQRARMSNPVSRADLWRPAGFAAAMLAFVFVPLVTARAYQQRSVSALLASYDAAPLIPLTRIALPASGGLMQIVDGHAALPRPRGSRSTYGDMIAVDLSGDCGAARTSLTFRYQANHEPENFTRTLDVALPAPGAVTRMFIPTFESGAARVDDRLAFGAIEVPAADITCVTRLGRFADPDRHALLLPAVLTGDWAQEPLYQRLIRWEGAATIDAVRAVSYWSPPELRGAQLAVTSGGAAGYQWPVDYNANNAVVSGDTVVVSGLADASGSYLVAWRPRPLAAGSVVQIEGRLERGGFTLGFVDDSGWRASVDIDRAGAFTAAVQLPSAGRYQLVVANHLREGARANRFTISRIALVSGGS